MDKSAIFVDAGYLLARGGLVVCGTKRRAEFDCAYEPLIGALTELSSDHCKLDTLRLYWYDGAPDRIPTPDHLEIGNLPYVKVGVQVVVVGIKGRKSQGTSQSRDLVREADEHLTIDNEFLKKFFRAPANVEEEKEVTAEDVVRIGRSLGGRWAMQATRSEMQAVLEQGSIPREIDAQLLRDASRDLGTRHIPDEYVSQLRSTFKDSVKTAIAEPATGEASLA
jgi:hypothetical protein